MRKRSLSLLLVLAMVCSFLMIPAAAEGIWYEEAMSTWASRGVLTGDENGNLNPEASITRAELATMLDSIMDYQVRAENTFGDIKAGDWYVDYVLKANAAGVLSGDGGNARPNDSITRQEAAVMLARVMHLSNETAPVSSFSDEGQIASWALNAVRAMAAKGYIAGSDGKMNPNANISRAEVAVILHSMFDGYFAQAGTYTDDVDGNAVINTDNVTLRNMTISGDLIVAEGVANGHIELDSVTLGGKLIVRGGGENSIIIKGDSTIDSVVVARQDGKVRVSVEGNANVSVVYVDDGNDNVKIEGTVTTVTVAAADTTVEITGKVETVEMAESATGATLDVSKDAKVENLTSSAENTKVAVSGTVTNVSVAETAKSSTMEIASGAKVENLTTAAEGATVAVSGAVTNVTVTEAAKDTTVEVAKGATVSKVETAGNGTAITGDGAVKDVTVTGGEGTKIETPGTNVENKSDAPVDVGGKDVPSGETGKAEGNVPSGGGGSSSGGGGSSTTSSAITGSVAALATDQRPAWAGIPDAGKMALTYEINGTTIKATGTLAHVTGFSGFNTSAPAEQSGHYAALRIPLPASVKTVASTVFTVKGTTDKPFAGTEFAAEDSPSMDLILRVDNDENTGTKNFTVVVDWDGAGSSYTATTYTIDFSDVILMASGNDDGLVATVGKIGYSSVANAIAAAPTGTITLQKDASVDTVTIGAGQTLVIPAEKTLTVTGTLTLAVTGTLTVNGTITNSGTIVVNDADSLQAVVRKCSGTVKLGSDITTAKTIEIIEGTMTLDMDGKKLTHTGSDIGIKIALDGKSANVTFTGNGTMESSCAGYKPMIAAFTGANVTFANGTYEMKAVESKGLEIFGKVTVTSGTFNTPTGHSGSIFSCYDNGELTITDGTFNCNGQDSVAALTGSGAKKITINGGTFTGTGELIISFVGEIEINGGTFTQNGKVGWSALVVKENGTLTVKGGNFTTNQGVFVDGVSATFNATGGTLSAKENAINGSNANDQSGKGYTINISGGTFTSTDAGMYLPVGGTVTISGDNTKIHGDVVGIAIRGGTLNITGGTITNSTERDNDAVSKTGGPLEIPGVIVIAQPTTAYQEDITVKITDGTLTNEAENGTKDIIVVDTGTKTGEYTWSVTGATENTIVERTTNDWSTVDGTEYPAGA